MSRFNRNKDIIHQDVDRELVIDVQNLNGEVMDQPLLLRKWTRLLSEVRNKAEVIGLTLKEKEAEMYIKYASDGTGKKVKEVESAVLLDPEVKKLNRELLAAQAMTQEFEGIVKSFYQRHEALKDLCANRRKDLVD